MAYTKQTWIAPTGTGLSRYAKSGETETHVELALDPVNLTNTPTPFTMERMAYMEEGIAKAYDTAPPTPWAQYSGKDIPQLPDNVAGTTYKSNFATLDSWSGTGATIAVSGGVLTATSTGLSYCGAYRTASYGSGKVICFAVTSSVSGTVRLKGTVGGVANTIIKEVPVIAGVLTYSTAYVSSALTVVTITKEGGNTAGDTISLQFLYIGTGAYDRLVFDNSYHYRHLLNNAVVPTPQGLYFNGATSYLRSKEPVTLPDVFTFSATVNCNVHSSTQAILKNDVISVDGGIYLYIAANSTNVTLAYYDTVNETTKYATVIPNLLSVQNTDIKIGIEIDFINQVCKSYVNGELSNVTTVANIKKPTVPNYLFIGVNNEYTSGLLGYMRNICIFDTSLTDTQRNWLAQGNTPPILYDVTNYELGNASKANVRVSLRHGDTWFDKTFAGLTDFSGTRVWTDGENIYYSDETESNSYQFVLNKAANTLVPKTWTGINPRGPYIWTDGENIYYSYGIPQRVLNKSTSTWVPKTWTGLTNFNGDSIWTDGENIYYSNGTHQYVLNKATSTWVAKTWTGLTNFYGDRIWTDGENIYYSAGTTHHVLNKATSTWILKLWDGLFSFIGQGIWKDGENIYYSYGTTQYVLNKSTATWVAKTWTGLNNFNGDCIWADGDNVNYSYGTTQFVLPATRHNYVDDNKYNSLFGTVTKCNCSTLSDRFVFRNE